MDSSEVLSIYIKQSIFREIKNSPKMLAQIFWIKFDTAGTLGIIPRPRGGDWLEDELKALSRAGVTTIVSLLEPLEEEELNLTQERILCEQIGISYLSLPIPDRDIPKDLAEAKTLIERLALIVASGEHVAIHCRQGIGRAPLIACSVLIKLGFDVNKAVTLVSQARGCQVPETEEQIKWLNFICNELQ